MIIEFSISNFRSFREMETLSMVAAPIRSKDKELDVNNVTVINDKLSLLRSKAIYGANASGKSNIIRAFSVFKRMVHSSVTSETSIRLACNNFLLDSETDEKPVYYQLIFIVKGVIYRYGFEAKQNAIISEWLYSSISGKKELKLFTREEDEVSVNQTQFAEAKKFEKLTETGDSDIFEPHSLFLGATAAVGVKLSKSLQLWISLVKVLETTENTDVREYGKQWWTNEANRKKGIGMMKSVDVGIENIGVIEEKAMILNSIPKEIHHLFNEDVSNKNIHLTSLRKIRKEGIDEDIIFETLLEPFESEGTKKFFYLVPIILNAFELGSSLWIDEFDARLHPLLTKKIVSLFHSTDTNPKGAQLIFATHDTNLLKPSFLRRDQICFVEKDKAGASRLKTLVEYKGVRNDASYDKDYLQGRYGAVPFLNELDEAVEKSIADND